MKCGECGKEIISFKKFEEPVQGGMKVDYEKGRYYPVCKKCAKNDEQRGRRNDKKHY